MNSTSDPEDNDATIIRPSTPAGPDGVAPVPFEDAPTIIGSAPAPEPASPAPARVDREEGGNALPVGSRQAEFEVIRVLGEGGFGIVYLARDHALERTVALKEYMPAALALRGDRSQVRVRSERHRDTFQAGLKSFINEARLLAQFDHPSLVKVYRFWEANGTAFMVMPFIEGKTLKDTLKELPEPPTETWLIDLLAPLTEALLVLHGESCYHRDIAPDNIILVNGNGARPLLLDFGAARRVIGDMTQALTVILKPGYAPIEQYAEVPSMKQGPWTDVYALAAVVYCAITGRTPPPSVGRMVKDDYVPLAQLSEGRYSERLAKAVDRALQVLPDQRTQSMTEFREDLGLAGHYAPKPGQMATLIQAPAAAPAAPAPRPAASRTPLLAGLGLAGLAVAAAAWFATRPAPAPVPTPAPVAEAPVAAPTPAPAPVPAEPVARDLPSQFRSLVARHSEGFDVHAEAERPTLRIDRDDLRFSVSATREGYVYVLLAGPDGSLVQLYPNDKAKNNHIGAGETMRLPGANWPLKASDPPGPEHFFVLVTAEPRSFAPWSTEKDSGYGFLTLPAQGPAGAPPGWLLGQPDCGHANCKADYGAAVFSVEAVK
ncbi:serine/threonine protein kinase [Roseateles sp. NT4]|uniref:serine/threonine protein kinase n=1 Tax=Roseateles sp. NT4 TaxID=3453715 RepID=UPI003EED29F7